MILVDAQSVSASRPGRALFSNLSFTVSTGERIGIVGINGGGKSTLMRVLAGTTLPESGTVRRGRGATIQLLDQNPDLGTGTVRDAVGDHWEMAAILDKLGMAGTLDRPVDTLSGGQAKRVALAAALVSECDLLLLDEPTNHLDLDSIAWLEERLARHRGALVLITHDRHVLDRVTSRILELDRGRAFVHEGGYDFYLEARAERDRSEERTWNVQRNLAKKELEWLRRGAPARTSKPKARIESATALVNATGPQAARSGDLPLHFDTPRLGDIVVELEGVSHRFGPDSNWLFENVELRLDPRERLGIVGPNGAGKTTLLNILSGRLEPATGSRVVGVTAELGVVDQSGADLDPTLRVRDAVVGPHRTPDWRDAALMSAFWFDEDAQWAQVGTLSGGERRRLQLLKVLASRPNVLFLDEPTNDLDLDTLRALEAFLDDWPGALVAVSHDRAFLERVVADVIVIDENGPAGRRPGGYARWEEQRHLRRGRDRVGAAPTEKKSAAPSAPTAPKAAASSDSVIEPGGSHRPPSDPSINPSTVKAKLRELDKALKAAQRKHDKVQTQLAEAAERNDYEALATLGAESAAAQERVDEAEEAWLEQATIAEEAGITGW